MNQKNSLIETLYEGVEDFGKTTYQLTKLRILKRTTVAATFIVSNISVLITLVLAILMLSLGIAIWLGELLGNYHYGFFIVAFLYFIAALIMHYFLQGWIKKPLSRSIIVKVLQ